MRLKSPVHHPITFTRCAPGRRATSAPATATDFSSRDALDALETLETRRRLLDGVHQYPHPDRERALVHIECRLVQVQLWAAARPHSEAGHRAGHLLEVPREVLAAAGLARVGQHVGADRLDRVRG